MSPWLPHPFVPSFIIVGITILLVGDFAITAGVWRPHRYFCCCGGDVTRVPARAGCCDVSRWR
ncbi:hypothetical protein KCP76_10740 [Salmonella enterica subsp. enterica serovar Weltevreden]|nr:hypothetical protein KCP76_10740 [Salmonella enterica subsp. enterica serovar Weltevreden]